MRALLDKHGRVATDLRVSLTDRCNLRCSYCMPPEGLEWMPSDDILSDAEVVRLVGIGVNHLGVTNVRLTGGEPLIRRGLVEIVSQLRGRHPTLELSMTTNGLGLERMASSLAEAGLDRINVSLDTIDRATYFQITQRDRLPEVLRGLEAAHESGLAPVKINAVLIRGKNADQAAELLRWAIDHSYQLRFIEQMPLDAQHQWDRDQFVTTVETQQALSQHFTLTPATRPRGSDPAELYLIDGGPATVGIIASVSAPFCGACNRVRLTADGQVRTCLFARKESDLRSALREDASDFEIAERWRTAMWGKPAGHGMDRADFVQPERPMSGIGG